MSAHSHHTSSSLESAHQAVRPPRPSTRLHRAGRRRHVVRRPRRGGPHLALLQAARQAEGSCISVLFAMAFLTPGTQPHELKYRMLLYSGQFGSPPMHCTAPNPRGSLLGSCTLAAGPKAAAASALSAGAAALLSGLVAPVLCSPRAQSSEPQPPLCPRKRTLLGSHGATPAVQTGRRAGAWLPNPKPRTYQMPTIAWLPQNYKAHTRRGPPAPPALCRAPSLQFGSCPAWRRR